MIPIFPEFKKLEFSDKKEVEEMLHRFPTYSDFDFASLWSWNVKEDMRISKLHGNLALRFIDYLTGEPFYTFVGDSEVNKTADQLISFSEKEGCGSDLRLVPHVSVEGLDPARFAVVESPDHFDYVFELEPFVTYSGKKLKSRRNFLNNFKKNNPHYKVINLDLADPDVKGRVTDLYRHWEENKGFLSQSESFAYDRFLGVAEHFAHMAIGLELEGKLIAVHISSLPEGTYANGLFEKADIAYTGVYQTLMHEVAKELLKRGRTHLNYEQDLGIENLRKAKQAFNPVDFLKKYNISRKP